MRITSACRTPFAGSAGHLLAQRRGNEFGYVDRPIEAMQGKHAVVTLSAAVKERLQGMDMKRIRLDDLVDVASQLHRDGHLSHFASEQFALLRIDESSGPVDVADILEARLTNIRGVDDHQFAFAIDMYEAALDAARGLSDVIALLNPASSIDEYV